MFLCVCVYTYILYICIVVVSGSPLGEVLRGSVGRVLLGLQMRQSTELHNLLSAVLELNYLMRVIKNFDRWDWLNAGRGPRRIHIIITVADSIISIWPSSSSSLALDEHSNAACAGKLLPIAVDGDDDDEENWSWSWTNCGNCKNHLQASSNEKTSKRSKTIKW